MFSPASSIAPGIHGQGIDRKVAFDAGYSSYEDGKDECDFGLNSETLVVDPKFAALWRYGWQRAHQDSALSRRGYRFE